MGCLFKVQSYVFDKKNILNVFNDSGKPDESLDPGTSDIYEFQPGFYGSPRHVEIGMMYNEHKRLAKHIGEGLRKFGYDVKYNEPYSAIKGGIINFHLYENRKG